MIKINDVHRRSWGPRRLAAAAAHQLSRAPDEATYFSDPGGAAPHPRWSRRRQSSAAAHSLEQAAALLEANPRTGVGLALEHSVDAEVIVPASHLSPSPSRSGVDPATTSETPFSPDARAKPTRTADSPSQLHDRLSYTSSDEPEEI